jgi:pimeloyl-ACP methyl ester carboxylesterase
MTEMLDVGAGRRLACSRRPGRGPTILFLPGYASDMEGGKASALDAWAAAEGRAMLRFDYGGCGASPGEFEAQSLDDWRNDAISAIDSVEGPVVLVGSSMGGWLMLLPRFTATRRW